MMLGVHLWSLLSHSATSIRRMNCRLQLQNAPMRAPLLLRAGKALKNERKIATLELVQALLMLGCRVSRVNLAGLAGPPSSRKGS